VHRQNGFVLLEVLVAMTLVASSWIVMVHLYQGLILRQSQLLVQKEAIRKELDALEIREYTRSVAQERLKSESSRVPHRAYFGNDLTQAHTKKQR
jgi:prepilin-type N-terminal cleavage/methylation domain-containing protein